MSNAWQASPMVAERWAMAHCASPATEMTLPLFCQGLRYDLGFQALFDIHLLQASAFVLQLLHAGHQRGVYAAELAAPFVERGIADAVLAVQLRDRRAAPACLRMAMIWLSIKRDVFMQNFQKCEFGKFYL